VIRFISDKALRTFGRASESQNSMTSLLAGILSSVSTPVEKRLFAEYGAVFLTTATPPPRIIFTDEEQVEAFQSSLSVARTVFGQHEIELQTAAMAALVAAEHEIATRGGTITARAADAGSRSYEDTVRLWTRNVNRGLQHWQGLGRMTSEHTVSILGLSPAEQVAAILSLEDTEELFFGTFFDKSILYSVAAPGASQHLSKLAFDVAEYEDSEVKDVLGGHGWYRTVPHDLPHFTYMGRAQDEMWDCGLERVRLVYGALVYDFWIPDLARLRKQV
jgi:hypothetical protein